MRLPLLRRL